MIILYLLVDVSSAHNERQEQLDLFLDRPDVTDGGPICIPVYWTVDPTLVHRRAATVRTGV